MTALAAASAPAEKLSFGPADWTVIATNTATILAATQTGVAGLQHFITKATLSYSAAPAVSTFTVKDGTTVIFQAEIPAGAGPYVFDFQKRPLRATQGASLVAGVGSAGGAVVQTITMEGFTVKAP